MEPGMVALLVFTHIGTFCGGTFAERCCGTGVRLQESREEIDSLRHALGYSEGENRFLNDEIESLITQLNQFIEEQGEAVITAQPGPQPSEDQIVANQPPPQYSERLDPPAYEAAPPPTLVVNDASATLEGGGVWAAPRARDWHRA